MAQNQAQANEARMACVELFGRQPFYVSVFNRCPAFLPVQAVRRHVTGPASPAALNGNAPSRQVLPLQAQEVDPMRE
eukprot:4134645-Amphidinium_carterae.1